MQHFLYIIYSNSANKFYVGETDDLIVRLDKHNSHAYKNAFSNIASDWEIVLSKKCKKEDARYLERFIKRMKSRKSIIKIIDNPDILDDILHKK